MILSMSSGSYIVLRTQVLPTTYTEMPNEMNSEFIMFDFTTQFS
jgi:hypothetical protein